jgi:regulator of protease activity HflC (stomatin/prohibitin superfamily)
MLVWSMLHGMDDLEKWILRGIGTLVLLLFGGCLGYPYYNVYSQRLEGEAELAKADYSKRVAVQEANAKRDSATLLAEADVMRAEGVAKANKIIGDSLKDNEGYLRYLWISELKETKDEIIYVPTEANLPILEANRLAHPAKEPLK